MIVNIGRAPAHTTITKAPFKTVIYLLFETVVARRPLISQLDLDHFTTITVDDNNDNNISLIHIIGYVEQKEMRHISLPQLNTSNTFIHDNIMYYLYGYT